jgi:adenylosuccinate lyase
MNNDSVRGSIFAAEVEVEKVLLNKAPDLGVEFKNQIDAWSKMEFKFRSSNIAPRKRYARNDLIPLVYSIREYIE